MLRGMRVIIRATRSAANLFGKGEGKLSGEIEDLSIDPDRSSIPSRGKSIYFVNQSQVWDIVFFTISYFSLFF